MEIANNRIQKLEFDEAIDIAGYGKYNVALVVSCCLMIMAMGLDMFNVAIVLPAMACDLGMNTQQQGILSAIPLIGVLLSSYPWGLCADMFGRRRVLMLSMPVGVLICMATSFAPTYASLVALKFLSAFFTASANAASFALLGESVPPLRRSQAMLFMSTAAMGVQLVSSGFAVPVLGLGFHVPIPWLNMEYTPWRLVIFLTALPGLLSVLILAALYESPKFLLSKGREDQALQVLKNIYSWNTGAENDSFPVTYVYLDESNLAGKDVGDHKTSVIGKMWNQTAPLFKPPLLKNSAILYYLFFCAFMITTAYNMFVATVANIYFSGDATGKTFCEVASTISEVKNDTTTNCDDVIKPFTLYAVMFYSGAAVILNVLVMFIVKPIGKKGTTLLIFIVSTASGVLLLFVKIPLLSLGLFFMFLYICLMVGNATTYLIELNPTHLRAMATCLSVIVARGFGFVSVQIIAALITDHCSHMIIGYVILAFSGCIVVFFLPPDAKKYED